MAPTALITGIAGQDGSYLTELLLDDGYRVHGFDCDADALRSLRQLFSGREDRRNLTLYHLDVTDASAVQNLVATVRPDELYNLAAQSRVDRSYIDPDTTFRGIVVGTANVLEAVRRADLPCRVFQASTSEMFGNAPAPQREDTAFHPVSPYARAKLLAHRRAELYRDTYGMYVCAGLMFNHESSRRSTDFVTRKITDGVARILAGERSTVELGNLQSRRDWGHARDYVRAMRLMLCQPRPQDYVVATGVSHSVEEFARIAFEWVDLRWQDHVSHDPARLRPADPSDLRGDPGKIQAIGWKAEIQLDDIVREMLETDLRRHRVSFIGEPGARRAVPRGESAATWAPPPAGRPG